jgi:alpha-L-rhamnosidase
MTTRPALIPLLAAAVLTAFSMETSKVRAQAAPPPPTAAASARTLSIVDAGAKADDTMNTQAIQKAIDTLAAQGGGTLVVPAAGGKAFLTGALYLKPGVHLRVEKDAILKGSTDLKDYPLTRTRIEGHFQEWVPALVNAIEIDNLQISGEGTLDGSGTPFYAAFRTGVAERRGTKNLDVPRPRLIFIQKSKNISVKGIHLLNSGFWNLHVYNCDGVTIDGLDIRAPQGSPSTDGIDIDSSRNVLITNTFISNNDDCIALKGTKSPFALQDKDSPPVENIRVTNCTFAMGGSLVTCGSEATIVRNVVVENCTIAGPNSRGINMLRLKLRTDTPQHYEDIHYNNITLDGVGTLINISPWTQYEDLMGQPYPTHTVRNITLKNIKGKFGGFGTIRPNPGDTIENFTLEDIDVTLNNPRATFAGVTNFVAKNVKINGEEWTPTIAPAPTTRGGRGGPPATAPANAGQPGR